MIDWYRWETEAEAQACLDYINGHGEFPITGSNALTGEPAPDCQKTNKWADLTACTDGKFGFPRVDTEWLDYMNISQEERDQFMIVFHPTIEQYNPSWMPGAE